MVEICFGDNMGTWPRMIKKEANSEHIISIPLSLQFGKLDGDIIKEQAKHSADNIRYYTHSYTKSEFYEEFSEKLKELTAAYNKMLDFLSEGREIRLWVRNNANDYCALFWLCSLLSDRSNTIYIVNCLDPDKDGITSELMKNGHKLSYTDPDFLKLFIPGTRLLREREKSVYAEKWNNLVKENYYFRLLIGDTVVSVNENFLDEAIFSYITKKPISQFSAMGHFLGKFRDPDICFVSKRIESMIQSGKVKIVEEMPEDTKGYWERLICRV